jgi:glyoxylase-like metal-dependent hydrolase (beta-lactamase superfamily II)
MKRSTLVRKPALIAFLSAILFFPTFTQADNVPTKLELTKVADNVYSAIGATEPPTYENHGHNNNLSFIITDDGVLVVNGGDNYLLAKALHNSIKEITDQPVKYVVNENAQSHSYLGNSYWRDQGVPAIAHNSAIERIKERGEGGLANMKSRSREKAEGTYVAVPEIGFDDKKTLQMGSTTIEVLYFGPGHSTGDVTVWLPKQKLAIAGDIAFHERMIAIFSDTDTEAWVENFNKFLALNAETVIPGHGHPTTDVGQLKKYTQDYLQYLRDQVTELLENGEGLEEAYKIDQSAYSDLDIFEAQAGRNAGLVYQEMEFDFF